MRARLGKLARRPLVVVVSLAVVILAGGGAYWLTRGGGTTTAASTTRLVPASLGTIRQSLPSTGTIEPADQAALTFAVSGKVTSVRVAEGDKVSAGAVLATVDSAELAAALAQAKATLANSQARLAADHSAAASDTQLAADQAAVTTGTDQVNSAQQALAEATLTSPIAGVVATVNVAVGQHVSGSAPSGSAASGSGSASGSAGSGGGLASAASGGTGSSSGSGSSAAQFLVISTDSWIVNATVDSSGVGLIAKGDQATIVPGTGSGAAVGGAGRRTGGFAGGATPGAAGTAAGGSTVYGTISSVGLIATSSSGTASFPVVIEVTGNPPGLHAGDTATVSLIYRQLSNVLTVPTLAVSQVDGHSVVYRMSGGKRVAATVTTGVSSGGLTEIKSGLAAGDEVVVDVPQVVGGSSGGTGRSGGGLPGRGGFGGGGGFGGSARFPGGALPGGN